MSTHPRDDASLDASPSLLIEQAHADLHLDERMLRRLIEHVLAEEGFAVRYLGVILTDHATVLELNRTYLEHDYLTDVLSFSLSDEASPGRAVDGEVYVDLDTATERHDEFGASFEAEAARYVVHGLLHLLGYDDATPEERSAMQELEDRYLASVLPPSSLGTRPLPS